MQNLFGDTIEQFYIFLARSLSVLSLCFKSPSTLFEKLLAQNGAGRSLGTGSNINGETSSHDNSPEAPTGDELPNPFSFLVLLSLFFAVLSQYLARLIQTSQVESFLTLMDSLTFASILTFTVLPFFLVFVLSRLISWSCSRFSKFRKPDSIAPTIEPKLFTAFFCYTTGFQMFLAICFSGAVLMLIATERWNSQLLSSLNFIMKDHAYPFITFLMFVGGFWAIFPLAELVSGNWRWGTAMAILSSFLFMMTCPLSLFSFLVESARSYELEQRGISIFVCDMTPHKGPIEKEQEKAQNRKDESSTGLITAPFMNFTSYKKPLNDENNQRHHVELKLLVRNEGQSYYYFKKQGATVYLEDDFGKRLFEKDAACLIKQLGEEKSHLVDLPPRIGEVWLTVLVEDDDLCLWNILTSSEAGLKMVFHFRHVTGQNLYSGHVSEGKFDAKIHSGWLKPIAGWGNQGNSVGNTISLTSGKVGLR